MTDRSQHNILLWGIGGVGVAALAWIAWAWVQRQIAAAYSAGQVDGVEMYVDAYRGAAKTDCGPGGPGRAH